MIKSTEVLTDSVARWLQTYRRHLGACVACGHPRGQHFHDQECADCVKCERFIS